MSADQRESPRAAIRSWLHRTDIGPEPRPANSSTEPHERRRKRSPRLEAVLSIEEQPLETAHLKHDKDRSRPGLHEERGHESRRITRDSPPNSRRVQSQTLPKQALEPKPGDPGFAEHLGLHAPFRNFNAHSDDLDADFDGTRHPKKRRRRESSISSYLEPAEIDVLTDDGRALHAPNSEMEAAEKQTRRYEFDSAASCAPSKSSSVAKTTPMVPSGSYEKRPRRKTREDRYELKETTGHKRKRSAKKDRKDGEEGKKKRKKHKEKSGAALMHSFTAHNVAHDRLTLQPAKTVGLFGRGRASSPVRRRGLPDLAFNEMNFLNSRRMRPDEPAALANSKSSTMKSRRKSTKAADTEAEISRYFTSTKATTRDTLEHRAKGKQQKSQRRTRDHDSPPAFIDLPDNPFLGFGSCGAVSVSPVKRLDSRGIRDLEKRLTRSPKRSTSYFTWSESGVPSQPSPRGDKQVVLPLATSKYANRIRKHSISTEAGVRKAPASSPPTLDISIAKPRPAMDISPQRGRSEDLMKGVEVSPGRGKRPHNASPSRWHLETREAQYLPEGIPLKPAERMATHHAEELSPRMSKPGSREQRSPDSADQSVRAQRRRQSHENDPRTVKIPMSQTLTDQAIEDLPDTAIDELLDSCKCRRNKIEVNVETRDARQLDPRLDERTHVRRPAVILSTRSQEFERSAQGNPDLKSELPTFRPVSDQGTANTTPEHAQRPEQIQFENFIPAASGQSTNVSNTPNSRGYAPEQYPGQQKHRADSRSAWNGYSTIYELQEDAVYPALPTNSIHVTTYDIADQGFPPQLRTTEPSVSHHMHERYEYPNGVECDFTEQQPELLADQFDMYTRGVYQEQGDFQEDQWQNGSSRPNIDYQDPVYDEDEGDPPELAGFWTPRMGY